MGCVLQDNLKKFVSEPPPPPQEVEIPEEGKTKAKERREVGEGDDTVIVEDTSDEDDHEETLQDRFQLRSRFSRPGLPHVPLVQDPPASLEASLAAPPEAPAAEAMLLEASVVEGEYSVEAVVSPMSSRSHQITLMRLSSR
jgi:hypothetical protein